MIRFLYEGKPCYANVYVYDTSPQEYHVHFVNSIVHSNLPESLLLVMQNEKLCLQGGADVPGPLVDVVVKSVEEHQAR